MSNSTNILQSALAGATIFSQVRKINPKARKLDLRKIIDFDFPNARDQIRVNRDFLFE